MRRLRNLYALVTIAAFAAPAGASLTLNAGDTYIASFSTLPDSSVGAFGYSPSGAVTIHLSDFQAGSDQLQFYMFEETPGSLLPAGGVAEAGVDGTSWPGAFTDYDGGVYFNMLAGSVTLEDITFFFQEPVDEFNSLRHSLTVIPTPEPGATALVALSAAGVTCRRRRVKPTP